MSDTNTKRILYIEDDRGLAQLLAHHLAKRGYDVELATSGEEGIAMLAARGHDVVLVDYKLPTQSGLEVLSIITKQPDPPPVIILTGEGDEAIAVKAIQTGASHYLVKDAHGQYFNVLPTLIEQALEHKELLKEQCRAQKALHRYEVLIEKSSELTTVMDAKGTTIYISSSVKKVLGYEVEEVLNQVVGVFTHPDDTDRAVKNFKSIVSKPQGTSMKSLYRLQSKDGRWRWMETHTTNMLNEPLIEGIVIHWHDVTSRIEAEQAVEASEKRYRTLFEQSSDGIFIIDLDGQLVSVNQRAAAMLGTTPDVLIGLNFPKRIFQEQWESVEQDINRIHAGEQRSVAERILITDGENLIVECDMVPIYDENGAPLYIQSIMRDITERKQAEDHLRRSEERFRQLFEHAPIGMVILDRHGQLKRVNNTFCNLVNYNVEELIGRQLDELTYPADRGNMLPADNITTETAFHMECRLVRHNGQVIYTLIEATGINYQLNEEVYLLAQITDITDRRKVESQINEYVTQLELLQQVEEEVNQTLVVENVLRLACDTAMRLSLVECVYISMYDANTERLTLAYGINTPFEVGESLPMNHIAYAVSQNMTPMRLTDLQSNVYRPLQPDAVATMCVPLMVQNQLIGTLTLETHSPNRLSQDYFQFLRVLAGRMAIAIDNANLYEKSQRQIAELKQLHERLDYMAYHDPLTDLPNRFMFQEQLKEALEEAKSTEDMVGVLLIDLDNFKQINDNLGHLTGDAIIKQLAQRVNQVIRDVDLSASMGSDIIVLLRRFKTAETALLTAEALLQAIRQPIYIGNHTLYVTASIGISLYPSDGANETDLLMKADSALHQSKLNGKNIFQRYDAKINAAIQKRFNLSNELYDALSNNQFTIYYQPQISLRDEQPQAMEALLRWQHPTRGLLLPRDFIPIAEEIGLMNDISNWIIGEVCRNQAQLIAWGHPLHLSFNVNASHFEQADFVASVTQILQQSKCDPSHIQIEVTEHSMLNNFESSQEKVQQLKALGLHIALDNFGAGYSSLSYLQHLAIDTLKLDRTLIAEVDGTNDSAYRSRTIAQSIITLGKNLGLTVVSEGIERQGQLDFLRDTACDQAQGFFLTRPIAFQNLKSWLESAQYSRS